MVYRGRHPGQHTNSATNVILVSTQLHHGRVHVTVASVGYRLHRKPTLPSRAAACKSLNVRNCRSYMDVNFKTADHTWMSISNEVQQHLN